MMGTPNGMGRWWTACFVALAGCVGGPSEPVGGEGASLTTALPLPEVSLAEYSSAAAGCEDRLDGTEGYGVTARDALVVALRDGEAFCVDTLGSVELELAVLGLEADAQVLRRSYFVTVQGSQVLTAQSGGSPTGGEPNPQPSIENGNEAPGPAVRTHTQLTPTSGEPNPQPSDPAEGEPNPQPSMPTEDSSSTSSSTTTTMSSSDTDDDSSSASTIGGLAGATTS